MKLLLPLVLALMMLGGCYSAGSNRSPLDRDPYRDSALGFAINLPAAWPPAYLRSNGSTTTVLQISRGDFVGEPDSLLRGISITVNELSPSEATGPLRGRLARLDTDYAQTAGDFGGKLSDRSETKVAGQSARRFTIEFPNGEEQEHLELTVTETPDYKFEFACEAPDTDWATISDLCHKSADTFRFEGSVATAPAPTPSAEPAPVGTPTVAAATVVAAKPSRRCGSDLSIAVDGDSPIGRTYRQGDTLTLRLRYHAPGCREMTIIFDGFHSAGSQWYEYWCVSPGTLLSSCSDTRVNSTLIDDGTDLVQLPADDAALTVTTSGGTFPPSGLSSEPPIDGFTLCHVSIGVDDGIDEGGGVDARLQLGGSCPPDPSE